MRVFRITNTLVYFLEKLIFEQSVNRLDANPMKSTKSSNQ